MGDLTECTGIWYRMAVVKSETSSRGTLARLGLRKREPRASKGFILAARIIVGLAGLLFAAIGALLIASGSESPSWAMICGGVVIVLPSLLLVWAGLISNRSDVCDAAVVLVADFLFGIFG